MPNLRVTSSFDKWAETFESKPNPLFGIEIEEAVNEGISLLLKREDFIDSSIRGNKFRKLKYNILYALTHGYESITSIGGAYSNHLLALAKVTEIFGIRTYGLVRGECPEKLSPVLQQCIELGMEIRWVSRNEFRNRENETVVANWLKTIPGNTLWIPEGGANALSLMGCRELPLEIEESFDYLCLPCGTAGTLAGCIASGRKSFVTIGYPVLKNGEFLHGKVQELSRLSGFETSRWFLETDYHFGGYAKTSPQLVEFAGKIEALTSGSLRPDLTYNAKALFGVIEGIRKKIFAPGSTIIYVVTQGN